MARNRERVEHWLVACTFLVQSCSLVAGVQRKGQCFRWARGKKEPTFCQLTPSFLGQVPHSREGLPGTHISTMRTEVFVAQNACEYTHPGSAQRLMRKPQIYCCKCLLRGFGRLKSLSLQVPISGQIFHHADSSPTRPACYSSPWLQGY